MSSDIVLSSALRTNLLSLQNTQSLIDRTQLRLSTGRKVNSALDNPLSFFASESLNNRATDLSRLLDGIGQSISTVEQANNGVEALTTLVEQAQATATSAVEAAQSAAGNISLTGNEDLRNIQDLVADTAIANGDKIVITVSDPSDPDTADNAISGTITISSGESINDLISEINDLNPTTSDEFVRASLDANGQLQIEARNGGNIDINFNDLDGTGEVVAQALGLDEFGNEVDVDGVGTNTFRISRVADSGLSLNLFESANTVASRSDTLISLENSSDGTDSIFGSTGAGTATFEIRVNGDPNSTTGDIDISTTSTTTLQDLIDQINTTTATENLIRADFNEDTGELRITAIDSSVTSIDIVTSDNGAITNTGFGGPDVSGTSERRFTFGGGAGQLAQFERDFNNFRAQIDALVADSDYRGTNLLSGDDLETFFNEERTNSLVTEGANLTSAGLGITAANFASADAANDVLNQVQNALATVRNFGSTLANDLSIIQTRESFTQSTVNTLKEGADKLTLADQNEEGANLLSLQTRQQLGVTALSLASQSQQAVLRLF